MLLIAASMLAITVISSPAYAVVRNWNSKLVPLQAKDGSTKKASGYGTWKIGTTSSGTRSQAYGYLRDDDSNGYNVYWELFTYVNAGSCFQPDYTSCTAHYYYYDQQFSNFNKETWNHNYWSGQFYGSTSVASDGDFARAQMQVSESNSGPDTHSGYTYTKGNHY